LLEWIKAPSASLDKPIGVWPLDNHIRLKGTRQRLTITIKQLYDVIHRKELVQKGIQVRVKEEERYRQTNWIIRETALRSDGNNA